MGGVCDPVVQAYRASGPYVNLAGRSAKSLCVETTHGLVTTIFTSTLTAIHAFSVVYFATTSCWNITRTLLFFPVEREGLFDDEANYCKSSAEKLFNIANMFVGNSQAGIYRIEYIPRKSDPEERKVVVGGLKGVLLEIIHGLTLIAMGTLLTLAHLFATLYYTVSTITRVLQSVCCFPHEREGWFQEEASDMANASQWLLNLNNAFDGNRDHGYYSITFKRRDQHLGSL